MYIKKLQLLNFQVIKEFNAEFDGNVYFITGDNELGKSTLLKAIGALLTGNRDKVLKNGESKGFAKMVVGDDGEEYEVSLSFTEADPRGTLSIKSSKTGMQSNNVSMLQKIFGYQDFDAVEFSRWSETAEGRRKQIAVVKNLLPEKVRERIEQIDKEVTSMKSERTEVNRDIKTFTALYNEVSGKLNAEDVIKYGEPINVSELLQEQAQNAALIEKAKTVRAAYQQRKEQLDAIPGRIEAVKVVREAAKSVYDEAIKRAKDEYNRAVEQAKNDLSVAMGRCDREMDSINADKDDFEKRRLNAEKWLASYEQNNPEKSGIPEKLAEAEHHNKMNAIVKDAWSKKEMMEKAIKKADDLNERIGNLIVEKDTAIASSKLPIKGLSFTDDGLELNGVPFVPGKVSDSQIMEVAAKLVIVSNPTVKVFRIARGESLGAKRLQNIVDIAKKYGYQGFIEQVQRGQTEMMVEEYTETDGN